MGQDSPEVQHAWKMAENTSARGSVAILKMGYPIFQL
jgi:hypothetical protein